jgi:PhzF family phenazine biosynthesis protein
VPFGGNPAVVCLLDEPCSDAGWMQSLAAEMNVSETAFVALAPASGSYGLRWFTPTTEVQLCGHGTLASAHALWSTGRLESDRTARFRTRFAGELRASRRGDDIALDFPALASTPVDQPAGLAAALGVPGASISAVAQNPLHHLVELTDADTVRGLDPDLEALSALDVAAVVVTAPADDDRFDFVSRYFAPRFGIAEDPVTGSAHCSLGPWWSRTFGRSVLRGYQASARGGIVGVEVLDHRVTLSGRAVTVWTGTLTAVAHP